MNVGDKIKQTRRFTFDDVKKFANLSGDHNPIHVDPKFAASTNFKKPIVHGILVSSIFSSIIANDLPGPGSIYLGQNLKFKGPVYHDQTVTFEVKIQNIREDKPIFTLSTICHDKEGNQLIEGDAVVLYQG